jgi:hypothetical protein
MILQLPYPVFQAFLKNGLEMPMEGTILYICYF